MRAAATLGAVIVVAGAGLAGLQTVVALREQGYDGALVLLGAEADLPYDRPPLSKEVLRGDTDDSTLPVDLAALEVDLRLGTRLVAVGDHVAVTDRDELSFDRLVLATGAEPRRLPAAGGALVLRTREDALRLRSAMAPGSRLAIVGAGWIGAEVATVAAAAGVAVTVLEAGAAPLASALPAEVTARMLPWWQGVDLRLGTPVTALPADADAVLVAVGAVPVAVPGVRTTDSGAVAVDRHLRTSLPDVFAVGDCAAWESARYGTRMHVEHWDNALRAPAVAAANALGGAEVYDPVPYFWSEQWGRMVQYAGHHPAGERLVWREEGERWAAFWLSGPELVAALAVDRPRDLVQARHLMERHVPVDPARLADPAVPVRMAGLAG